MRPDEFRTLLLTRPFVPFRLHLTTGIAFEVRHPEMAVLGRSIVNVYTPSGALQPSSANGGRSWC